jgi:hypothetical protein
MISAAAYSGYLAEIRSEASRAWSRYGMVVLPGPELTWDDERPEGAAHAVAGGLDRFVGLDAGLDAAVETARDLGAAVIAAHPHGDRGDRVPGRTTRRWSRDAGLRALAHRFELINRAQVFEWVAEAGLPAVASGDHHRPEHLLTWKTVLPVERDPAAVVAYLRSSAPAMIMRPSAAHLGAPAATVAA